jgi:glycine dehydrogenase
VHRHGGQVYVDGANMNAMVGLCARAIRRRRVAPQPAQDVLHPARRRRPGVGPVAVARTWRRSCPAIATSTRRTAIGAVSAAPFGSASILPISWMYIEMMGDAGLTRGERGRDPQRQLRRAAPRAALPGAVLGPAAGRARMHPRPAPLKETSGIQVEDVAKRLIDYGFHAPTMSFPVAGTLMVEPTESESQASSTASATR